MKDVFCFIIGVWLFSGVAGIAQEITNDSDSGINWEMLLFCLFVPFIPIVAKVCGLF